MSIDTTGRWRRVRFLYRGAEVWEEDEEGTRSRTRLSLMDGHDAVSHRAKSLRILTFSDFQDKQNIKAVAEFAAGRNLDLIIYGGDAIDRFHEGGQNLFEELASRTRYGVCAVAGNDDDDGRAY